MNMSEFPLSAAEKSAIKKAGIALAGDLIWTPQTETTIREVFDIANAWRLSHAAPMRKVRSELIGHLRRLGVKGLTAARLKRMPSVRKKLRNTTTKLHQIQDLAGCRAILRTMEDVRALVDSLKQNSPHALKWERDYINQPKPDGYRSYHMVFQFAGRGDCPLSEFLRQRAV
jgi:(p)ppGpp synthase/HD superfamily hydrolase